MANYSLYIGAVVVIAVIAGLNGADPPCPKNQTWSNCTTRCPLTCDNPKPRPCTRECASTGACVCKDCYLLKSAGICVLEKDCNNASDPPCPKNQTWSTCTSPCPPTCAIPNPNPCAAVCQSTGACACKAGYLLKSNGDCVLEENC